MAFRLVGLASLVLAALSLGPSFAHVLEAGPRLAVWPPELWRETTVFHRQFMFFAIVGAPVDVGAILVSGWLAWLLRRERPAFRYALAGLVLLACGLATWFAVVAPANAVLATWQPGPIPAGFEAVRDRWEIGHMIVTVFKLFGFVSIALSVLAARQALE